MTLGEVLCKERARLNMSVEDVSSALGVREEEYQRLEGDSAAAEQWGLLLARFAMQLEVPTSRLIAESGKADDFVAGECGRLIREHRLRAGKTADEFADEAELSPAELMKIEDGDSELEQIAPKLLRFAELIEQPIFNLFYPCGLPLKELEDYP